MKFSYKKILKFKEVNLIKIKPFLDYFIQSGEIKRFFNYFPLLAYV